MVNYNKQKPYLTEIPKPTESTHVDRSSRPSTPDRQTGRQAGSQVTVAVMHPGPGSPWHPNARPHLPLAIHLSAAVGLGEGRLKHVVLQQADG